METIASSANGIELETENATPGLTRRRVLGATGATLSVFALGGLATQPALGAVPARRGVTVSPECEVLGHIVNRESTAIRLVAVPVNGPAVDPFAARASVDLLPLPPGVDPLDEDAVALAGVEADLELGPGTYNLRAIRLNRTTRRRAPIVDAESVDAETPGATGDRLRNPVEIGFCPVEIRARPRGCGQIELRNRSLYYNAEVNVTGPDRFSETVLLPADGREVLPGSGVGSYTVTVVNTARIDNGLPHPEESTVNRGGNPGVVTLRC